MSEYGNMNAWKDEKGLRYQMTNKILIDLEFEKLEAICC